MPDACRLPLAACRLPLAAYCLLPVACCLLVRSAGLCPAAVGCARTAAACFDIGPAAAGVGLRGTPQVRPCRLSRGIHAAHAPANPPRPRPRNMVGEQVAPWPGMGGCDLPVRRAMPGSSSPAVESGFARLPLTSPTKRGRAWPGPAADRRLPRPAGGPYEYRCTVGDAAGAGLRGCERHGSGVYARRVGQEPNPGLAVCAGQRTRASGDQAPTDVLAASPADPHPARPGSGRHGCAAVRSNPKEPRKASYADIRQMVAACMA
jgi:hypothetical protein